MPKEGPNDPAVCPACGEGLTSHWRCLLCACFGHDNIKASGDTAICQGCDAALEKRGRRRCKTCGAVKAIEKFNIVKKYWRRRQCKACQRRTPQQKDYQRRWQQRNRDTINASARRRYAADPTRILEQGRASYRRNRPARLARTAAWRAWYRQWADRNQDHLRAYRRAYYHRRKARILLQVLRGGPA